MQNQNSFKPLLYSLIIIFLSSPGNFSQDLVKNKKSDDSRDKENLSSVNFQKITENGSNSAEKILINGSEVIKLSNEQTSGIMEKEVTIDKKATKINSAEKDKIEITLESGEQLTQTLTIENQGSSTLIWNIAPEGSEKMIYRLYEKDRILTELSNPGKEKSDYVITSDDFIAKETIQKFFGSKSDNIVSEVLSVKSNINEQVQRSNVDHVSLSIFSDRKELSKNNELSREEIPEEKINLGFDEYNGQSSGSQEMINYPYHTEIFENEINGVDLRNQLEIFQQWYHFADCGYPTFDPQTEVWEVSLDNGDHWQQILSINGESYVLDAECFNPVDFLEYHSSEDQESLYSNLTSLNEFEKLVESGPAIFPKTGIIPANTSSNIEIDVDAASLENGRYNPKLILTDAVSMKTIDAITLSFNVVPKLEKGVSNKLIKQTIGEEIPDKYKLFQNYPNPFNPATVISYQLPFNSNATLKVFDILGNEVATLVDEYKPAGSYEITWNAKQLVSGIYFYRLRAVDPSAGSEQIFVDTKKMTLLK